MQVQHLSYLLVKMEYSFRFLHKSMCQFPSANFHNAPSHFSQSEDTKLSQHLHNGPPFTLLCNSKSVSSVSDTLLLLREFVSHASQVAAREKTSVLNGRVPRLCYVIRLYYNVPLLAILCSNFLFNVRPSR